MDQQLLKDLVTTSVSANYQWDTILPLFPEFKNTDPQVLKDYVSTAKANNFDYSKVNKSSVFPEFFPPPPPPPPPPPFDKEQASNFSKMSAKEQEAYAEQLGVTLEEASKMADQYAMAYLNNDLEKAREEFESDEENRATGAKFDENKWVKENYANQHGQYKDNAYDDELREYAMQIKEETGEDMTQKQMRAWIKQNHPDRYEFSKAEKIEKTAKNADGYHFRSGEAKTIGFLKKDFGKYGFTFSYGFTGGEKSTSYDDNWIIVTAPNGEEKSFKTDHTRDSGDGLKTYKEFKKWAAKNSGKKLKTETGKTVDDLFDESEGTIREELSGYGVTIVESGTAGNQVTVKMGDKVFNLDLKPLTHKGEIKARNQINEILRYQEKSKNNLELATFIQNLNTAERDEKLFYRGTSKEEQYSKLGDLGQDEMDIINAIEDLTITKTGNSKMVQHTGYLGATSNEYAREYKVDYPGGSFTGTNYEIQDFFIKNPQLVPEGSAARKEAQKKYNDTYDKGQKEAEIKIQEYEKNGGWEYFSTYYNDKLTPDILSNLKAQGVEIEKGGDMEKLLEEYFDVDSKDKKNAIKNLDPEKILTEYYNDPARQEILKKNHSIGNLDSYLNKNLDKFTKAWNNVYDPSEGLKNLPSHKKEISNKILQSELENIAEDKNPSLKKVESVAQLLSKQELQLEQKKLDERAKEIIKLNDHRILLNKIELDDLVEKGQEEGLTGVELIGDAYVVSAKDEKTRKKYQEKLDNIILNYDTKQKEAAKAFENIENDFKNLKLRSEDVYSKDLLQGALDKDYDLSDILASDFTHSFENMVLDVGILFGSDDARKRKNQNQEYSSTYLPTMQSYDEAWNANNFTTYSLRTMAQQSAPIITAIATAGVGTAAFGAVRGAQIAMNATAGFYALTAAGGKRGELDNLKDAGIQAEIDLKRLEARKDDLDPDIYAAEVARLKKVIDDGEKLTSGQYWGSIVTAGVVEGTITRFLGTIPNSLKLTQGFTSSIDDILVAGAKNGYQNALMATGKFASRAGSEVLEESLIEIGNIANEALILGNDVDWSNLDDVAVQSLMIGGAMNGPGVARAGIMQHYATRTMYGKNRAIEEELANIDKQLKEVVVLPDSPGKTRKTQALLEQRQQQVEKLINLESELELSAMINGGKKTGDLIRVGNELNELKKQAGVDPRLSPEAQQKQIDIHIESLSKKDKNAAKEFKNNYDSALEAKEKLTKDIDFDGALESIYGEEGKILKDKLIKKDPSLKKLDRKEMLVAVHNEFKRKLQQKRADVTRKAYNGQILDHVEKMVYGGKTFEESGLKRRNRKKEDELLARYGDQLGIQSNNSSLILNEQENINAQRVLEDVNLEDLVLIDAKTDEQLQKALLNAQEEQKSIVIDRINRDKSLTQEQKQEQISEAESIIDEESEQLLNALRLGETNGIIVGGKYIVRDKKAAKAELKNGNILAGTVLSHEIAHSVDQLAFSGINEIVDYSKNLFNYMQEKFPEIHNNALNLQRSIGNIVQNRDGSVSYPEGESVFWDEYTKSVQDFMSRSKYAAERRQILNEGQSTLNKFRGMINGDYKINTPRDAAVYMASYIDNFKKGRLGELQRRRIDPAKKRDALVPTKMSKAASDKVQNIYNEKGLNGAMEIIQEFKPITSKIAERRREAPNYDKELLMSEIELGPRGIFDLIRTYKPDTGVPLAAYINQNLPNRAIEASRRVLGEEFTDDISERVDIAAEEVTTEVKAKPKPKKIILSERLGINDKVSKAIEKIVPSLEISKINFKNLKNKLPEITGDLFGIAPKKIETLANLTKSELQSAQMFINKNADLLINMLPEGATAGGTATGVPNSLLKEFYTKADRAKMVKTGSKAGLAIQQKNNINKKDFLEVFGIIDGKPDRTDRNTSARVLALANLTGKMITNQAVRIELAKRNVDTKELSRVSDGKSATMFSRNAKNVEDIINIRSNLEIDDATFRDKLLEVNGFPPTIRVKTEGDIKNFIHNLKVNIFPMLPKEAWFGPDGGTALTSSSKNLNMSSKDPLWSSFVKQVKELADDNTIVYGPPIDGVKKEDIWSLRNKYTTLFATPEKIVKNIDNGEINKFNKSVGAIHKALWTRINEAIRKDKTKTVASGMATYLGFVANDTGHWHKMGAQFAGYSKKLTKRKKGKTKVEYEHAMPATAAYLYLLDAAINKENNFDTSYDLIVDNYKLIALDKAMDDKLRNARTQRGNSLMKRMPDDWSVVANNWYERYFNNIVFEQNQGINPESIVGLDGRTFGEIYNINSEGKPRLVQSGTDKAKTLDKAIIQARKSTNPSRGITILDFDDTLATSKSQVIAKAPDGTTRKLNAEEFAKEGADLLDQGFTFDFSEFSKVIGGKTARLFNKALKLQKKFGPENMFVLTARPADSAKPIFDFLKANGLNIPLKNITGLANSTSEAKALWVADKVAEGYNDFYFADDALQNVQAVKNVLDQFDVKSKVQQAKRSANPSKDFNDILEETTGVESQKIFSQAQANLRGRKTKYKGIVPASAQDFAGLIYNFLGKGKKGEKQFQFFKEKLIDPFARGINELNSAKQNTFNQLNTLYKQFPKVRKLLNKQIEGLDYNYDQAVRVYLWNKAGFEVPGLSQRDLAALDSVVKNDPDLQAFAETLGAISKKEAGYSEPGDYWLTENIKSDMLSDGSLGDARSVYLQEWQENVDQIFSEDNLRKIKAIYGDKFVSALKDMLYRMQTGRARPRGQSRLMNMYTNWVNNSVGTIMFFNIRSAVLQLISATNYINWSDNNPARAAAAFANQPQFWKDFTFIFNSDFLKQRRAGNQRGINEAEISSAVVGAENKVKAAISYLLSKGFLPTQIADSFAIAAGGATFYRNRIKKYMKEGMNQKQAEEQAFLDLQETTEVAQQSARPDMISQQQAEPLGRLILAFQNTPMQYARIINKSARDLINGRGDAKTHISKIAYYGFIQGLIFGGLQSAIFAAMGDEDEEEFDKKKERILNGMLDSLLSGIGYGGKAISTLKNTVQEYLEQRDKGFRADHAYTLLSALSFSPPIGSKLRKLYSAIQTEKFNKDIIMKRGFTLDNPVWSAVGNVIEATTNIPLGRLSSKMLNIDNALDSNNETWQRLALMLGWNTWDLGIRDPDLEGVKLEVKEQKKQEKKLEKEAKEKEKEKEEQKKVEENKKKDDGRCAAFNKSGERCKSEAVSGGYCTVHEKKEQRQDGSKVQCSQIKSDGKRCKMQTSNKSGKCYYHD